MTRIPQRNRGFTYVELTAAVVLGAILILGLTGVVGQALDTQQVVHDRAELARQASEAMARMVRTVGSSRRLLLPFPDEPDTDWRENVREQTEPASPPEGSSSRASAVLAVTLPAYVDLDDNGIPDADNDGDGRIDEDPPDDMTYDLLPGLFGIDDDGDGSIDESLFVPGNDDEKGDVANEDPLNGVDDDGDGAIDEDPPGDVNKDGCPGVCRMDDDGDGQLDEGSSTDDDEDGRSNEDWFDPVVFYLQAGSLWERIPVPWDENGLGGVTGLDVVYSRLAQNVTRFRVERIEGQGGQPPLLDLTLELRSPSSGAVVRLHTQVRLGGWL